ncbi:MAG TPA: type I-E CRISPR-associated protein Cse2/CasB [Verrucomicrobiales bacterium]|nr:type I-E CRISPR-associated protein Cse2/CasB [Verrucomicrobiales bacterium]
MSETRISTKDRAADFVGALRRARNDRGRMAALRRGLIENPRLRLDAWPVIAALGGDPGNEVYVAVGALYASHPEECSAQNLGESCRRIAQEGGKDVAESFERRFRRLLACDGADDVVRQLRSWVRLAASKGIGLNYQALFGDLWNWTWYADSVRVKWARSFWRAGDGVLPSTTEVNTTSPAL